MRVVHKISSLKKFRAWTSEYNFDLKVSLGNLARPNLLDTISKKYRDRSLITKEDKEGLVSDEEG